MAVLSPAAGPGVVAVIVGALIAFCGGVAYYIAESGAAMTSLDTAVTATKTVLQNRAGNNTGFPAGGWPRSTQVSAHAGFADDRRPVRLADR